MDVISQESMSFAEDSPARISAPPERVPASTGKGRGSGSKCSASSEDPDPLFASLKTYLLSGLAGVTMYSQGWRRRTTPAGRLWWVLAMPELPTAASESGLWPTPTTQDNPQIKGKDKRGTTLGGAARMFPTPRANRWGLPDSHGSREAWTSPCADDTGHRKGKYAQGGTALSMQVGGQLNPPWVEWLMGYPINHTELKPSETPSSPPSPTPSQSGSTTL